ncbi:MAG: hypothetical protein HY390_00185 [Deltaproteobacteria bacterium]|nr:hypothetical protein [Deltaproteobacteria bacterium]
MNTKFPYSILSWLFGAALMFSCAPTDTFVEGSSETTISAERGMNVAESETFMTTLETLDASDQVTDTFEKEQVKFRIRIMNKTNESQPLRFRTGQKAHMDIFSGNHLIWSTRSMFSIQMIDEAVVLPQDVLDVTVKWDLLDTQYKSVAPGIYRLKAEILSEEKVPVPGDVIFEIQ